jgi:thiamine-phosphate pyrophosphorylase
VISAAVPLLGGVVVVTDRSMATATGRSLVDVVARAADGGASAVLVREKDLAAPERARLVDDLRRVTADAGVALLVASDVDLAVAAGADGVHLASDDSWPADDVRDRLQSASGGRAAISRSCHSIDELRAATGRADWATLSPIFPTPSKPCYGPALGAEGVADAHERVPDLAIVALGGVDPTNARACARAGADAVAVMGAVMRADDPAAVVAQLAAEVREGVAERISAYGAPTSGDR